MSEHVKRMAEMLKSGATLLSEQCPVCGSPIFDVKGKLYCIKCNRPVVLVRSAEEEEKVRSEIVLSKLEETVLSRLNETIKVIKSENEIENLDRISNIIILWLDMLDKIRKLKGDS
jgi:UPF0148 protein